MQTNFSSTRRSSSIYINFIVPQGWHELDDAQLRYVYSLIAKEFPADEIKSLTLLHFSGCKVIARHDKNSFLLRMPASKLRLLSAFMPIPAPVRFALPIYTSLQ